METTTLPKQLQKTVRGVARHLGVTESDLVTKAVLFYLATVQKDTEFQNEMRMWEDASLKDFASFENSLE